MAGKKHSARRTAAQAARNLSAILGRLSDAKAVIETAVIVLVETGDIPPEVVTAQQGLNMLHDAYNELDAAIGRLQG